MEFGCYAVTGEIKFYDFRVALAVSGLASLKGGFGWTRLVLAEAMGGFCWGLENVSFFELIWYQYQKRHVDNKPNPIKI